MPGSSECFYVWIILAFLGLALVVSLIFNISHYVEKQRQDRTEEIQFYLLASFSAAWSANAVPLYLASWNFLFCIFVLFFVAKELARDDSTYGEQSENKMYSYSEDYIPREEEYYVEDTPIYGNLDDMVPEPVDENCYEQMKARPERCTNELQGATLPTQASEEAQVFYASLDHNCEGKHRKTKKQNNYVLDKDEDEQLHAEDVSLSKTTLVNSFPLENQEIEENVHDDPIRLFGLIRAKKESIN